MANCTQCGKSVDPVADQYCPACGEPIKGGRADIERTEAIKAMMKSSVTWAGIFLVIAALPSLFLGIYALLNDMSVAQAYIDWWTSLGNVINMSVEDVANIVRDVGIFGLVVGILGIVGAVLCYKRTMWWVVLAISFVVLFFGFFSIIGLFLGLFAVWTIIMSKSVFEGPLS